MGRPKDKVAARSFFPGHRSRRAAGEGICLKKMIALLAIALVSSVAFVFAGKGLSAGKPSRPSIKVDGKSVAVFQGSYCWKGPFGGQCVDMAPPPDIIEFHGAAPAKVSPGAVLSIKFKKKPVAGSVRANLWPDDKQPKNVNLDNDRLIAPKEPGMYVYDIQASWDEGSASFVIGIEVSEER